MSDDKDIPSPTLTSKRIRRGGVRAESLDLDTLPDEFKNVSIPKKSASQIARLSHAVKNTFIFSCLEDDQMQAVVDAMFERRVRKLENVIVQGESGYHFFLIETGSYDILVSEHPHEKPKKVGEYINSGSFGELALMYNTPRAATIRATTDGILWCMDRDTFRRIVLVSAQLKRRNFDKLIVQVPILKELKDYERMNLADASHSETYKDKSKILTQGQPGKEMYFIQEGQVRITMTKSDNKIQQEIALLKVGDYFGELALLTHNPRAASAYAVGTVKLIKITRDSFERLLGPCLDIMRRNIHNYDKVILAVFGKDVPDLS